MMEALSRTMAKKAPAHGPTVALRPRATPSASLKWPARCVPKNAAPTTETIRTAEMTATNDPMTVSTRS